MSSNEGATCRTTAAIGRISPFFTINEERRPPVMKRRFVLQTIKKGQLLIWPVGSRSGKCGHTMILVRGLRLAAVGELSILSVLSGLQ